MGAQNERGEEPNWDGSILTPYIHLNTCMQTDTTTLIGNLAGIPSDIKEGPTEKNADGLGLFFLGVWHQPLTKTDWVFSAFSRSDLKQLNLKLNKLKLQLHVQTQLTKI